MGLFGPSIGNMERNKDVEGLINCLKDDRWGVRHGACQALGRLGDRRAVQPLINSLDDKNLKADPDYIRAVKCLTIEALGKIGDARAVDPLLKVIRNYTGNELNYAINALAAINTFEAIKALIDIAFDSKYWPYWQQSPFEFVKKFKNDPKFSQLINDGLEKMQNNSKQSLNSLVSTVIKNQPISAIGIGFWESAGTQVRSIGTKLIQGAVFGGPAMSWAKTIYQKGIVIVSNKELIVLECGEYEGNPEGQLIEGLEKILKNCTIKKYPLKEINIKYDENTSRLMVSGKLNTILTFPNFCNFSNSLNAFQIAEAAKNAQ